MNSERKGLIMAGGSGSRLFPTTLAVTKHLLPVYNKPMIFYPLSVLLQCKISEVCLVCNLADLESYKRVLGTGEQWGIEITYAVQDQPRGIAEGLIIAREFLDGRSCTLILGDNIFYGESFLNSVKQANERTDGATIFGYRVRDPERYGVAVFDETGRVTEIVEKPKSPPSNYAITGLYMYDDQVCDYAAELRPSGRGELEITDLNNAYLERGKLHMEVLGHGNAWLDTGTHDSLLEASEFVRTVEHRQGVRIACLEEIAYQNGFIQEEQIRRAISRFGDGNYGEYLRQIVDGDR